MSTDALIEASPCKLRNGNWGCKTAEPVTVGDTVKIVTRAGKEWPAQITQIVWTDDTVCICETASEGSTGTDKPQPSRTSSRKKTAKSDAPTETDRPPADVEEMTPGDHGMPPVDGAPTDELDAMADRAAEQDDDFDELMNAAHENEHDST